MLESSTLKSVLLGTGLALVALSLLSGEGEAQDFKKVDPDPNQPVRPGFNMDRAIFWAAPNFIPLRDPEWSSLKTALREDVVSNETPVVVFEAGGETLTLVTSQMSYHHVAQGVQAGEPWMVTF